MVSECRSLREYRMDNPANFSPSCEIKSELMLDEGKILCFFFLASSKKHVLMSGVLLYNN